LKRTGGITHVPRHKDMRTVPAEPVYAPVSGPSESDSAGGKTPSGAGDVPRFSLRRPGLWCIAHRQDHMPGRNIANEPSFSPD
jgi:hypothetical protein